ncbi:MAG: helix-turn-helix domain-containing protein [Vicinamibacterales bacterium]
MAYDRALIFEQIQSELGQRPRALLPQVARAVRVERHLVEEACRAHGVTFAMLKRQVAFSIACDLLATSSGSTALKEIAAALGYPPRSFSRFIQSMCGISPSALRAHLRRARRTSSQRLPTPTSLPPGSTLDSH